MLAICRVIRFVLVLFLLNLHINIVEAATTPWLDSFTPQREFFVSPAGTGPGTSESDPMSLSAAISSAQPGDLYWLLAGTYTGLIQLTRDGETNNPIVYRSKAGDRVIIIGGFEVDAAYNWIWGMEITDPAGIAGVGGVQMYAEGIHVINNSIHDQFGNIGIGAWNTGKDHVVYGNIVYSQISNGNNPHNIYAQNEYEENRYKYIVNNMFLDSTDATPSTYNVHAYAEGSFISGFYMKYNIIRNGRFLIGGYNAPADREKVISNYFYNSRVQFGYAVPAQVKFKKNYLARGTLWIEWFWGQGEVQYPQSKGNTFTKNEIVNPSSNHMEFRTSAFTGGGLCTGCVAIKTSDSFNNNKYSTPFSASFYADGVDLGNVDFSQWKSATGNAGNSFDADSSEISQVTGTKIDLLPNDYENGRGHLAIYNWDGLSSVNTSLSPVVSNGQNFWVLDPRNPFGTPILSGVYNGPVNIPLGGQEFGAFLILAE